MDAADPRQAAAEEFSQAAELDPTNSDYQAAAEVARQHLLTQLVQEAAKAKLLGQDALPAPSWPKRSRSIHTT